MKADDPEHSRDSQLTNMNRLFHNVKIIMKDLGSIRELGVFTADEDPQYDLIEILKKIECQIDYLAEARDHLDRTMDFNKMGKMKITLYEKKIT